MLDMFKPWDKLQPDFSDGPPSSRVRNLEIGFLSVTALAVLDPALYIGLPHTDLPASAFQALGLKAVLLLPSSPRVLIFLSGKCLINKC